MLFHRDDIAVETSVVTDEKMAIVCAGAFDLLFVSRLSTLQAGGNNTSSLPLSTSIDIGFSHRTCMPACNNFFETATWV